jgi:antigen 43
MLLHPDFRVNDSLRTWQDDARAPLVVDAGILRPIWQSFADRAEQLGFVARQVVTVTEPDLHIVVAGHGGAGHGGAGQSIAPTMCSDNRYVFVLPRGTEKVVLASRASRPADVVRYLNDRRSLGVAVGSITVRMGDDVTVYPADHLPAGRSGWHAYESTETALWRWTDGAGELQFEPLARAAVMEIRLSGTVKYIAEEIAARLAA